MYLHIGSLLNEIKILNYDDPSLSARIKKHTVLKILHGVPATNLNRLKSIKDFHSGFFVKQDFMGKIKKRFIDFSKKSIIKYKLSI